MPRRLAPLAVAALAIALLAGCGDSSSPERTNAPAAPVGAAARSCETRAAGAEALRVSGVSCRGGRQVMLGWQRSGACAPPAGASRSGCTAASYRCLGARTARGLTVSCSRPGRSVAFLAKRP